MDDFEALVLEEAEASPCEKRKVGAIFVHNTIVLSSAHNYNTEPGPCECPNGGTYDTVVHAEVAVLDKLDISRLINGDTYVLHVTHEPCDNCEEYINSFAKENNIIIAIEVVEEFMKFDSGKLNYDLIPATWIELDAEVLTKGAQKYKPNNWKEIKPEEIMRYYSAAMRHIQDWKKFMDNLPDGHLFDDGELGIGTHHLANARTNLGFLLTLTETKEKADEIRRHS